MSEVLQINHDLGLSDQEVGVRIQKALDRDGMHDWEHLDRQLRNGSARMFRNPHGAWIVEIVNVPLQRVLNVWLVAGQRPGVMDLQEEVKAYGRKYGCHIMATTCRLGWSRSIGPEYGWKVHAVQMAQEL